MQILIGIDDTDNLESRGTGYRARCLGWQLTDEGFGKVLGITRHQLLVDPKIPYTSHNSSLCLVLELKKPSIKELHTFCREFLLKESVEGSDVGLCISTFEKANESVKAFGSIAKRNVLCRRIAHDMAHEQGIILEELTGDGGGVIGALAGVGLRAGGNDGRFVWLKGVRELEGIYTAESLLNYTDINLVQNLKGELIQHQARINVGNWPRPVLFEGKAVFIVEEAEKNEPYDWKIVSKEVIKKFSD